MKGKYVRHKKKNWRKYIELTDLEEWREEQRKEEALGTKAVDKTDEELFIVEKQPKVSISTERRSKLCHKSLKSERFLNFHVPSIRNKSKTCSKLNDDSSNDEVSIEPEMMFYHRQKAMANVVNIRKNKKFKNVINRRQLVDIWGATEVSKTNPIQKIPSASSCGMNQLKLPHPGMSYNPSFVDHQGLLRSALTTVEKENLSNERKLKLGKMTFQQRENQWLQEALEGLHDNCDHDDSTDEINIYPIHKKPVSAKNKKTVQQRRREVRRRKELCANSSKRINRIRMEEVYRIKSIKKELKKRELFILERKKRRDKLKKVREMTRVKRLGKHLYKQPLVDFQLSSEIPGNLRCLDAVGSGVADIYDSLLRRNVVIPKGPRTKSRYQKQKPKFNVKWTERSYQK